MLKKAWRLTKNEDFERVFRKGTPLFFGAIGCKILPNTVGHLRLGFSLGKRHLATAVGRNLMRRTIVEPFSAHFQGYQESNSLDIAFFTIKKVEKANVKSFASVAESVVKYISH